MSCGFSTIEKRKKASIHQHLIFLDHLYLSKSLSEKDVGSISLKARLFLWQYFSLSQMSLFPSSQYFSQCSFHTEFRGWYYTVCLWFCVSLQVTISYFILFFHILPLYNQKVQCGRTLRTIIWTVWCVFTVYSALVEPFSCNYCWKSFCVCLYQQCTCKNCKFDQFFVAV